MRIPLRLALLLLVLCAITAFAQYNKAPTASESHPAESLNDGSPRDDPNSYAHHQMLEKLFLLRQRQMAEASDRILRLATDLNTEVNHPLSAIPHRAGRLLQKAETIAKLAHAIRQQMASNDIH